MKWKVVCKWANLGKKQKLPMSGNKSKRQTLIREIRKARDELYTAETTYAWADQNCVDAAISLVTAKRTLYHSLVRQYKSLCGMPLYIVQTYMYGHTPTRLSGCWKILPPNGREMHYLSL